MHHVLPHSDSWLYWCLAYIREGIFDLCIYVTVTSPYLRDRGVTYTTNWSCPYLTDLLVVRFCNILPWILMSRSWSLEHVRAWNLWILSVADQSGATEAWIIGWPSRAPFSSWPLARLSSFPAMTLSLHLHCPYLYIFLYSRNCAILVMQYSCNIYHIWW